MIPRSVYLCLLNLFSFFLLIVVLDLLYVDNQVHHFLFPKEEAVYDFPFWSFLNSVGSLSASIVALVIAIFGDRLKGLYSRSDLVIKSVQKDLQDQNVVGRPGDIYYRLAVLNMGNEQAEDVEAYVQEIKDDGVVRSKFLPVPLRWTHVRIKNSTGSYRNIHPYQTVLLDFLIFHKEIKHTRFLLYAGEEIADYSRVVAANTEAELVVYQKKGIAVRKKIKIIWDEITDPEVQIL